MSDWSAHVLPHGPLVQLAPRLWQVQGTLPGMALPRAMTVWRMEDGGLWVHSAVACDDDTMGELAALGPVRVIVVPNGLHRLDAPAWKARFPEARLVCPDTSRAKVAERVAVDASDADVPGVRTHTPPGLKPGENVYELDVGAGRALVFGDALFNVRHQPGFGGFVLRVLGSSGTFGMTPIARFSLLADSAAFAGWLREVGAWSDLSLLCLCHGDPVLADPGWKLKQAAERLHPAPR
jgi:hypothetical protein